jgi:HPt (histidine-containing phosphotransfer) domain-containing protein
MPSERITLNPRGAGDFTLSDQIWQLIDRDATLRRLAGDESLFHELIDFFLDDHVPLFRELEAGTRDANAAVVERSGHGLKGLTANLGATTAAAAAGQVEECGRGNDLAQAAEFQETLRKELTRLVEALTQYRAAAETTRSARS